MPKPQRPHVKRLTDPAVLVRRISREVNAKFKLPPGTVSADPLSFLLRLQANLWPEDILARYVAGSPNDPKDTDVPMDLRMEAAKLAVQYCREKLLATEVSGPDGGPIPLAAAVVDVADMMKVPAMRAQIEKLSIEMSRIRREKMLEGRATLPVCPPQGQEDWEQKQFPTKEDEVTPNGTPFNERRDPDDPSQDGQQHETVRDRRPDGRDEPDGQPLLPM